MEQSTLADTISQRRWLRKKRRALRPVVRPTAYDNNMTVDQVFEMVGLPIEPTEYTWLSMQRDLQGLPDLFETTNPLEFQAEFEASLNCTPTYEPDAEEWLRSDTEEEEQYDPMKELIDYARSVIECN